jgi:GDP-L-fucose synthase
MRTDLSTGATSFRNLYGPHDNFSLDSGHVLPSLIRRFDIAKKAGDGSVTVWGSGKPRREFLHVDDLADACVHLMHLYNEAGPINVGWGSDISIGELAELVRQVVYPGVELVFDRSKPDGTPQKLLDVSKLGGLGWKAAIPLRPGLESTYQWFSEASNLRGVEAEDRVAR